MLVSTTPSIEGKSIQTYHGMLLEAPLELDI